MGTSALGRRRAPRRLAGLATIVAAGFVASGCSWLPRVRPVRDGEKLELQSAVVPAPAGPGWMVMHSTSAAVRWFRLFHATGDRGSDGWISISESDAVTPLPSQEGLLAQLSANARKRLGDPAAPVEEIRADAPPRFGENAVLVALRAEESDAKAGLLEKHSVYWAQIVFVPPAAPDRACVVEYVEHSTTAMPDQFAESWRTLLDGIELRPVNAANIAAAERSSDFPKTFEPRLARRSLTLPSGGLQGSVAWDRWIAPGGFTRVSSLAFGITDWIELSTPGTLRFSFGDVDALERPEFAVGAGLVGIDHDAQRGSVWSYGVSAATRKRLAPDVAVRGLLAAYGAHESRTARNRAGGEARADIVWDVHSRVTVGVDARWCRAPSTDSNSTRVWIGAGPLVTVHLPLLDLGVDGAAGWHDGQPGFRVGSSILLTL